MTRLGFSRLTIFAIGVSLFVFGFTIGLFTGWSRTPVVGSLVSGMIGMVSGGILAVFATKGEGKTTSHAIEFLFTNLIPIALGINIVCVSTVFGTIVGINMRLGNIPILIRSPESLTPISTVHKELPAGILAKLVMLQIVMDKADHDRSENNALIARYAQSLKRTYPLSRDSFVLRRSIDVLMDILCVVKANESYFTDATADGWNSAPLETIDSPIGGPVVLLELAKSLDSYDMERIQALRQQLGFDVETSLIDSEKHLDFVLTHALRGLQLQAKDRDYGPEAASPEEESE